MIQNAHMFGTLYTIFSNFIRTRYLGVRSGVQFVINYNHYFLLQRNLQRKNVHKDFEISKTNTFSVQLKQKKIYIWYINYIFIKNSFHSKSKINNTSTRITDVLFVSLKIYSIITILKFINYFCVNKKF